MSSTRIGERDSQRRRCSRSSVSRSKPGAGIVSLIDPPFQPEFPTHAIHGTRELLAQRLCALTQLDGQLAPFAAQGTLLGQVTLAVVEPGAEIREQIRIGDDP